MKTKILRLIFSNLLTLWAIATGTFLLMEFAPGGLGSGEKRLEPTVEAQNLVNLGVAKIVHSNCNGEVIFIVSEHLDIDYGDVIAEVRDNIGVCKVLSDVSGKVAVRVVEKGERVFSGQILVAIKKGMLSRYLSALTSIAKLDFGVTYSSRGERTVLENISLSLPVSASIGGLALGIALFLGITGGLIGATQRRDYKGIIFDLLTMIIISIPTIVLGPCLLYFFAIQNRVFPAGGGTSIEYLILPATTLGLGLGTVVARMIRTGAQDFLQGPVAMTLRARGISESRIVWVHGLRHALIPLLGFLPPAVASLLTGSVVVEHVFNVPGIARFLINAALSRDHPMVIGVVMLYSTILIVCNLLAEFLYLVIDPRLRLSSSEHKASFI